jgi:hypothetical protein
MNPTAEQGLEEGLRHYTAGDAGRALAAWYRVLDVDPNNEAALQYINAVRQVYRLEDAPPPPPPVPPPAPDHADLRVAPTPMPSVLGVGGELLPAPSDGFDISMDDEGRAPTPPPTPPLAPLTTAPTGATQVSWIESSWGDVATGVYSTKTPPPPPAPAPAPAPPAAPRTQTPAEPLFVPRAISSLAMPRIEAAASPEPPQLSRLPTGAMAPVVDELSALDQVVASTQFVQPTITPPGRSTFGDIDRPVVSRVFFEEPRPTAAFWLTSTPSPTSAPLTSAPVREQAHAPAQPPAPDVQPTIHATADSTPWDSDGDVIELEQRQTRKRSMLADVFAKHKHVVPAAVTVVADDDTSPIDFNTTNRSFADSAVPRSSPGATDVEADTEQLMAAAREYTDLGDFSSSLELIEQVLELNPGHEGARAYLVRNEATLEKMYESKLGGLDKIPQPLIHPNEVIWMSLHHRAGFILSQVDGALTFGDVLDVSGMPRLAALKILADLVAHGVIGVR